MKNYRPVALLSVAGMILERVIAIQIEEYFEKNKFLRPFQFGFRKHKSTVSELLTLFDMLLEAKEDKKEIGLVLYDLSSAFDTIDPDILCQKLLIYGFDSNAMSWVRSFLSARKQSVVISGKVSSSLDITIGCPQGSRLSPLLFLILMADLDLHVSASKLSNFADDTQSIIIQDNISDLMEVTKKEADCVIDFFQGVGLVNNPDKASTLFNSQGKHNELTMEIGGETLTSKKGDKLLGVKISSDLTWSAHVNDLCLKLYQRLSMLRRIKHKVDPSKLRIIAEAIFNSKIRYAIAVYGTPKFDFSSQEQVFDPLLKKIQVIQNDMLRLIEGKTRKNHTNMQKLRERQHMMSVNQMAIYHVALEIFNIRQHSSSESLQDKLLLQENSHYQLRNRSSGDVCVTKKPKKSALGFTYHGATLWNHLPINIKLTTRPGQFKSLLKKWIWSNIPSV